MSFIEGFALDLDKEMKTTKVEHSSVNFSIFIYTSITLLVCFLNRD